MAGFGNLSGPYRAGHQTLLTCGGGPPSGLLGKHQGDLRESHQDDEQQQFGDDIGYDAQSFGAQVCLCC